MIKVYSKLKPEVLTHLIVEMKDIEGDMNLSEEKEMIQVSSKTQKKYKPHVHLVKSVPDEVTQEAWVVIKGAYLMQCLDFDGTQLHCIKLNVGDVGITYQGGHSYSILNKGSVAWEFKSGCYYGAERDKKICRKSRKPK